MEENEQRSPGISKLIVSGYKSISEECSIDIAPLTILAGANSTGKSSIMQPLLLMKQTLEAPFDPGPLLLNGPHVAFTEADQLLSNRTKKTMFSVGIGANNNAPVTMYFSKQSGPGFKIEKMTANLGKEPITLWEGMSHDEIAELLPKAIPKAYDEMYKDRKYTWVVERNRCFLSIQIHLSNDNKTKDTFNVSPEPSYIASIIHLPGLRGQPVRSYPVTAVGTSFPGPFQTYTASVIAKWQSDGATEKLSRLQDSVRTLRLASNVEAYPLNDTQVAIRVSQYADANADADATDTDKFNITDVGVGVSQTLPILVALIVAEKGQMVYIEQPEIHLHPKAQVALATVLVDAAECGVRVVLETHSALLLLAIQTLVAEGTCNPDLVKLHWFTLEDGTTKVTSTQLDRSGAFTTEDWPEDFGSIELDIQNRYLSAAEAVQAGEMA